MVKVFLFILVLTLYGVAGAEESTEYGEQTTVLETLEISTETPRSSRRGVYRVPKRSRLLESTTEDVTEPGKVRWVAQVLHEAMGKMDITDGSAKCKRHGKVYKEGLRSLALWAVQMQDASAQSASGLLSGNSFHLGHFDECVSLSVPDLELEGRYCLLDIRFAPHLYPGFHTPHPQSKFVPPNNRQSVWERIRNNSDLSHRRRDVVHWAVCVLASCGAEAVVASFQRALQSTASGLAFQIDLPPNRCYSKTDEEPPSMGFYVIWAIIGLAATVALTATAMDFFVYQAERAHNPNLRRWLRPFSMYKNMGKLVTPNPDQEFAEFHVYKLIAIMFVISGHRQMYAIGQTPLYNVGWVEELNSYFIDILIMNGGVVVDTFFVLSGFLTCHFILKELEKHQRFNFPVVFFNRWIRIAPVYMLVVGFYTYIFPRLGDGPLWPERMGLEETRCTQNWWTNLLFINNYVHNDNQCMVQSWYLACDMHFFMVGSVLVYILWRWPKLGRPLLWASLVLSMAIPAVITYYNRYYGAVLHYMSLMKDPMSAKHYRDLYIPSHTRAGPYIVGIITAYIYLQLKAKKFKFSLITLILGSLVSGGFLLGSILVGWICYDRARPYILWENVLYAGTHRSVWAIGLAWFIVAEGTTGFGVFYKVMKHRLFTPFGRLTYCVFLVHTIPQIYLTASTRVPEYLTVPKLFWVVTGDGLAAYILALYLNLLFEAPLERLQKKTIKRLMKAKGGPKLQNELPLNGRNGADNRIISQETG